MTRALVIGGGITGLAAAHRLIELAGERGLELDVRLLEAGDRVGGVIGTEYRDGFILEGGPDSFITDKPWALQLCRRIGLGERVIGTNSQFRRSYVVRGGKLHPVPEGFQLLAPTRFWPLVTSGIFSWPGKLRMALDLVLPARKEEGDESIACFVERRLGREALERMAQPMVGGIYGANPHTLSLHATLPRFVEMERKHGSVIRAMLAARARQPAGTGRRGDAETRRRGDAETGGRGDTSKEAGLNAQRSTLNAQSGVSGARYGLFVSLDEGTQVLVDALAARLPAGTVALGTKVVALESPRPNTQHPTPNTQHPWRVAIEGGEALEAELVCLALPAYRSAALLERVDGSLAARLLAIPYCSAVTMNLVYRREDVPHSMDGFGFVVPAREGQTLLGCTFSGVKFPGRAPEGRALLRAFVGEPHASRLPDREIEQAVREDLRVLLGIRAHPELVSLWRHPKAMPQYTVGHVDRIAEIEAAVACLPGLALAGNAYRGVGIPDCIHSAETAAEALIRHAVPAGERLEPPMSIGE